MGIILMFLGVVLTLGVVVQCLLSYSDYTKKQLFIRTFLCLVFIGMAVFGFVLYNNEPCYIYTVEVGYINGDAEVIHVESKHDPFIESSWGTYKLQTTECHIDGIIRCKILSKRQIKKE